MNSKIKRVISLGLGTILTVSMLLFSACKADEETNVEKTPPIEKVTYVGTHDYTAVETTVDMVKDGRSDYTIIVPANMSADIISAKNEFVYLFKKATGITLNYKSDAGLSHNDSQKYISIGDTTLFQTSGITLNKAELKLDGVRIITEGNTVYLLGGSDSGVLNAVYTFMQVVFNFDCYYKDCYEIDTNVKNLKLKDFNITDIPDVDYRVPNFGILTDADLTSDYDHSMYQERMRTRGSIAGPCLPIYEEYDCVGSSMTFHNSLTYIPRAQFGEHPWYSSQGNQVCYTAGGDEAEFEELATVCARKITDSLKKYDPVNYPQKTVATMSMEDNNETCQCEACAANTKKYGSETASVILLLNRVCEKVRVWMEDSENAAYKREDFHVIFFAYHTFILAPTHLDETTGNYVFNEDLTMDPMLGVYAAINNMNYTQELYAATNDRARENLQAWYDVTECMYLWTYSLNYAYEAYMYDVFNFYNSEFYQFVAANRTQYFFNQGDEGQTGAALNWQTLATYLNSKLMWDSSLDSGKLMDKFFNAMYKDAAPIMKELFTQMRLQAASAYTGDSYDSAVGARVNYPELWPLNMLKSWIGKVDVALVKVEKYKQIDENLYNSLVTHIEIEGISPMRKALSLHPDSLNDTEYKTLKSRLISIDNKVDCYELDDFIKGLK